VVLQRPRRTAAGLAPITPSRPDGDRAGAAQDRVDVSRLTSVTKQLTATAADHWLPCVQRPGARGGPLAAMSFTVLMAMSFTVLMAITFTMLDVVGASGSSSPRRKAACASILMFRRHREVPA